MTIDTDWQAILADAITGSTLLEEHRYDRGDSPQVPAVLAFEGVTGIVSLGDKGPTRNMEVWQRQLMLPPGRTVPGDTTRYVERAFYYDVPGNLVQTVETNVLGGISRTSAKYDYLGNILVIEEKHTRANAAAADTKRTSYDYDNHGRIASEYVSVNSSTVNSTEFDYDIFGRLIYSRGEQGEEPGMAVQELYSYDIRGRLTGKETFRVLPYQQKSIGNGSRRHVNNDGDIDSFVFGQYLRYFNPVKQSSRLRWNGLISEIAHQHGENGPVTTNGYFYDDAGRLTDNIRYDGTQQTDKFTERNLSFDRNGNILSLKRYGSSATAPQDNLSYTYYGNRLTHLNNPGVATYTYTYDNNGNTLTDSRRGLSFTWNHLDLPASITSNPDGTNATVVDYTYLADGTKALATTSNDGYAYLGTMTYRLSGGTWSLESVPFTGGRFMANSSGGFDEYRYITDHLGSTRVIVTGSDYHEVEQNDYYPFGMRIADNTLQTTASNRWRFSGKEIQTIGGVGLVDFGARLYDDFRVQWPTQDSYSECYYSITPYCFCLNDPNNHFEADGNQSGIVGVILWIGSGHILEHQSGNHLLKEFGYAMNHPVIAFNVGFAGENYPPFWLSQKAANFAVNFGKTLGFQLDKEGGEVNAFRHVLWQAMIARDFGSYHAKRIGNAHEDNATSNDTIVDQNNNSLGRKLGEMNKGANNVELALEVLDYYYTKGLWGVVNNGVKRIYITQEQYETARQMLLLLNEKGKLKSDNRNETNNIHTWSIYLN
ncbi:MAG: RHS repeat protein [Bacteroidales bacterium]|nr:RHS repeat protein [Bacteroidales bacterium]